MRFSAGSDPDAFISFLDREVAERRKERWARLGDEKYRPAHRRPRGLRALLPSGDRRK